MDNSNKILVEIKRIQIAISQSGNWIFKQGNNLYEYKENESDEFILWLPLLEISFEELQQKLYNSLNNAGMVRDKILTLVSTFPVLQIISTALKSNSNYWVDLALNWCDQIHDLKYIAKTLESLSKDKKFSQKTRHHCLRLMSKTR